MSVTNKALLKVADWLGVLWGLVPLPVRLGFLTGLFVLESRGNSRDGLKQLLAVEDRLQWIINERAMAYGTGVHPKHRLTRYHDFFVQRIADGEAVLDIGCGYGAVARSVARARRLSRVVGVDYDKPRLDQARAHADTPANLSFVESDATKSVPAGPWDAVILSNVLEHIDNRPAFLRSLIESTGARKFLIRVPHFERDWKMPLRKELGANYFSDNDHKIEHTTAEFVAELDQAGLVLTELMTTWGEIWSVSMPAITAVYPQIRERQICQLD
jgi:2-polyprenyl-3-methyl-5-hydroxy-6-metoxy-1,4-benzoquinol methylase